MLLRVLEPEVMDTPEDAAEYDAMDFEAPNARFASDALHLLAGLDAPRAIDLGTGTARIPTSMLERHPRLHVVAVDLAEHMLAIAAARLRERGLEGRCELSVADVKAVDRPAGGFDLVMSNSTLHHLADPVGFLREVGRLAGDDGAILVRDLLRPPSEAEAWGIVDRAAPDDTPRQRQLFFDSLRAALTLDELRDAAATAGLGGVRIERVSDRHFTLERPRAGAPGG